MIVIHNKDYPAREFVGDHFEIHEDGQYVSGQVAHIRVGDEVVLVPLEPGDEVEVSESNVILSGGANPDGKPPEFRTVQPSEGTVSKGDN